MTERTELPFTGEGGGPRGAEIWGQWGGDLSFERSKGHPSVEVEWAAG